ETFVARSPQQNGVVERRNRMLIEVARTMLIYAKALLFLWAEEVSTACALCYPKNDSENLCKLQPKADIDFDELTTMASEHNSSGPILHDMTPAIISSGLVPNPPPSTPADRLAPKVIALIAEAVAPKPATSIGSPSSTTVDQDAPSPNNS
ncbi:retrovirus-related pol polyprotein from transposon TNT 1-94, partial [Tanacetum coccineum]